MSVTCYVDQTEMEFFGLEDVKDFFGLDEIDEKDFREIDGKHICVDPFSEDVHNSRVLMWADTKDQLDRDYQEACDDI